jgi:hypothetical protein
MLDDLLILLGAARIVTWPLITTRIDTQIFDSFSRRLWAVTPVTYHNAEIVTYSKFRG